jgi:hypothetical protein
MKGLRALAILVESLKKNRKPGKTTGKRRGRNAPKAGGVRNKKRKDVRDELEACLIGPDGDFVRGIADDNGNRPDCD